MGIPKQPVFIECHRGFEHLLNRTICASGQLESFFQVVKIRHRIEPHRFYSPNAYFFQRWTGISKPTWMLDLFCHRLYRWCHMIYWIPEFSEPRNLTCATLLRFFGESFTISPKHWFDTAMIFHVLKNLEEKNNHHLIQIQENNASPRRHMPP